MSGPEQTFAKFVRTLEQSNVVNGRVRLTVNEFFGRVFFSLTFFIEFWNLSQVDFELEGRGE